MTTKSTPVRRRLSTWSAIAFAVLLAAGPTEAKKRIYVPGPYTMYKYPIAGSGQCIAPPESSARDVLRRNGIGTKGRHSSAEENALAKGINQVERLLGGRLPLAWRTNYVYISTSAKSKWNQGGNGVNVRRPRGSQKGANVARLMHELGHKVGNAGGYARYFRFTGGKFCRLTGYSLNGEGGGYHDQFAEVFSAYVTYPDLLARRCPDAYRFFSKRMFPHSGNVVATCQGGGPRNLNPSQEGID